MKGHLWVKWTLDSSYAIGTILWRTSPFGPPVVGTVQNYKMWSIAWMFEYIVKISNAVIFCWKFHFRDVQRHQRDKLVYLLFFPQFNLRRAIWELKLFQIFKNAQKLRTSLCITDAFHTKSNLKTAQVHLKKGTKSWNPNFIWLLHGVCLKWNYNPWSAGSMRGIRARVYFSEDQCHSLCL